MPSRLQTFGRAWPVRARALTAAAVLVFVQALTPASALRQEPEFRGGVEAVTIDVVVLDRAGAPVSTLTAKDFSVVAGRKPRRVISTEFVRARSLPRSALGTGAPAASSNMRSTPSGRTLVFVVDEGSILTGSGRLPMTTLGAYLDRLPSDDRVGLVTLPSGSPHVDPTTNRAGIKEAVSRMIGASSRLSDRDMTFGEAVGIAGGDRRALAAYWARLSNQGTAMPGDRSCEPVGSGSDQLLSVPAICIQVADRALQRERGHALNVMGRLGEIAKSLAPLPGAKSIILLSGGFWVGPEANNELKEFAALAERSRVSVHALLVEALAGTAASGLGDSTQTMRLDNQIGLAGLTELAVASRGAAHRVLGASAGVLEEVDRQLSGYYLVSFERDAADRNGERVSVEVRVNGEGLSVSTRREVTVGPAASAPAPAATVPPDALKDAVAQLLKSSTAVPLVPMEIDTFALPQAGTGQEARVILAVELGRNPADIAALGFQVADATGKVVADGYNAPVTLEQKGASRALYLATVPVRAGRFIARVGVVDARGRRGSLQHVFQVPVWESGQIRVSDLLFGDSGAGGFRPGAGVAGSAALAVRVVVRDDTSRFDGVRVRVTVTLAANDAPVETIDLPLQQTPDPVRRFADGQLSVDSYPPGEYMVRAVVSSKDAEVATRQRMFIR